MKIKTNSTFIIYLDMDGVLVNLKKGLEKFINKHHEEIIETIIIINSENNDYLNHVQTFKKEKKIKILKDLLFKKNKIITNPKTSSAIKTYFWTKFIDDNGFYKLEATPEEILKPLRVAVNEIKEKYKNVSIQILGSTGHPSTSNITKEQKIKWLKDNKNKINIDLDKYNYCPGSSLKRNFASPNALLIDDKESNCEEFRAAGGHAYLFNYQNYKQTIKKIRRDFLK